MSAEKNVHTSGRRAAGGARKGGLGKGLGALIPSSQAEESVSRERPLDVLFPDLRGESPSADSRPPMVRGGSARDLLNPRTKAVKPSVSRETISPSVGGNVSRETENLVEVPGTTFGMLKVSEIIPNTKQPRQIFERSELEELSDSLREVGLLQPIVVRPIDVADPTPQLMDALRQTPGARYELIMGERRLRAAGMAEMTEIPAIVRVTEDENLLRDALLENLHRSQLNPLEEAAAYAQLLEDFSCTQEELSQRIARSRPQIANTLRLLRLPASVQRRVAAGVLSAGHARALLALTDATQMEALGERIVNEGLSVRATEEIVRLMKDGAPQPQSKRKPRGEPSILAMQVMEQVSDMLDTQVTITEGKAKGRIVITFADQEDLQRIAETLRAGR